MHVFSLSLLYYANAHVFGVIFMRRNLLNLEKVYFFYVCLHFVIRIPLSVWAVILKRDLQI